MNELPADAVVTVNRARISAGNAMSYRADPTELFDIKVDKLARGSRAHIGAPDRPVPALRAG
jgi:hypothetical protein